MGRRKSEVIRTFERVDRSGLVYPAIAEIVLLEVIDVLMNPPQE
jgi:hypothetical protein